MGLVVSMMGMEPMSRYKMLAIIYSCSGLLCYIYVF